MEKKASRVPHTYVIILFIVAIATLATYIVPAGEFEREEHIETGRTVVVDGTYQQVEQDPVGPFGMFQAIPQGMEAGARIIFFILLVGAAFGIIKETGAIEAGIGRVMHKLMGKEVFIIPVSMILFSITGFSIGMAEESIIFVPIGVALARALGFDAITGTAMITLGAASGFIGGMMNPFTVGVAHEIAELPPFSGFGFRSIVYLFVLGFSIFYVMRYAFKVKKNPELSVVYDIEMKEKAKAKADAKNGENDGGLGDLVPEFTKRHLLVFLTIVVGLSFNMYGVFNWDWSIQELTTSFVIMGLTAGLIGGLSLNKVFDSFVAGASTLVFGALIVGFARAILIVLEDGFIIDTIIFTLSNWISILPQSINILGMFIGQLFLNFFIPSGSGQAATTMPIMIPLADLLGLERQAAVLAFQYGDAISNSIIPTSAALMGYLAIAGIPYDRWFKFIWKLIVGWAVIAGIALVVAVFIGVS